MLILLLGCLPAASDTDLADSDPPEASGDPALELPDGVEISFVCEGDTREYDEEDPAYTEQTEAWGLTGLIGAVFIAPDLDGDGYADLVATELFTNARDDVEAGIYYHRVLMNREFDGRRTFVDATLESGLLTNTDGGTGTAHSWYIAGDVDNDADLDLYAGRYHDGGDDDLTGDRNALYLNDGAGHFTLATASGLEMEDTYPSSGGSFTDADGDGNIDLWLVGWYQDYGAEWDGAQPHLYMGNGDGTFVDITENSGLELKSSKQTDNYLERGRRRPGFGATTCDLTGDGLPELLHTSYGRAWNLAWKQVDDEWVEFGEEAHFDMDENREFTDNLWYACYCESNTCNPEPTESCSGSFPDNYWTPGWDDQDARLAGNSFTTICGDLDNDGDQDLLNTEIAHSWAGDSSDRTEIMLNDGTGIFERVDNETNGFARDRPKYQDWNEGDLYGAFFDYDNDSWKDILLITTDYEDTQMWVWNNQGQGQFKERSDKTGLNQAWPNGAAIADFDRDGDLDLVDGSSNARSGSPWATHEIHFYENGLGGRSMRISGLPVGTRVDVDANDTTQTFEVSGGYGHWGMFHDQPVHVGLGDTCTVDNVRITPPGGTVLETGELAG